MAICTLVCMTAMMHAGFSAVQSNILNIQHLASGDIHAGDGGWIKACDGERDDCDGHAVASHEPDGGPIHHHHGGAETQFGTEAGPVGFAAMPYATPLDLRPGDTIRLAGRYVSTPDQPPRV